jgi:TATA-binding protein-associated factor
MCQWAAIEGGGWPFQRLCDQLLVDILDPCWEVRHGATAALREVLRHQAAAAGVEGLPVDPGASWDAASNTTSSSSGGTASAGLRQLQREVTEEELQAVAAANREWLEECLALLLCVLALDQYADYSADQVRGVARATVMHPWGNRAMHCPMHG